jgi:hypothetical protein
MRKAFITMAAALLAAAILMPTSADARCRGCGVAAGVLGGVAAGAIIGSAIAGPRYYEPAPVYVAPPPAYIVEEPICRIERQRVWVEGYGWRSRRVEICG